MLCYVYMTVLVAVVLLLLAVAVAVVVVLVLVVVVVVVVVVVRAGTCLTARAQASDHSLCLLRHYFDQKLAMPVDPQKLQWHCCRCGCTWIRARGSVWKTASILHCFAVGMGAGVVIHGVSFTGVPSVLCPFDYE
jgi:hypothetical protein